MHITMNNIELKEAVELWLENEGLTPDRYDIDVKFVAGRNGNEGRIEINAQKKITDEILPNGPIIRNTDLEKETKSTKENPFKSDTDTVEKKTVGDLFKA